MPNLVKVNGIIVEEGFTLPPNADKSQESIMLHYDREKNRWGIALWTEVIFPDGQSAFGWEDGSYGNLDEILAIAGDVGVAIEDA